VVDLPRAQHLAGRLDHLGGEVRPRRKRPGAHRRSAIHCQRVVSSDGNGHLSILLIVSHIKGKNSVRNKFGKGRLSAPHPSHRPNSKVDPTQALVANRMPKGQTTNLRRLLLTAAVDQNESGGCSENLWRSDPRDRAAPIEGSSNRNLHLE